MNFFYATVVAALLAAASAQDLNVDGWAALAGLDE